MNAAPHRPSSNASACTVTPCRRRGTNDRLAPQRGVAALAVTMLLVFVMLLGVGFVNRNLVFEQRASVSQYRSTQAFEAAEAGLEWALSQLDRNQRIGPDCLPSADASTTSFRSRHLIHDPSSGAIDPVTWPDGATVRPLQAACIRSADSWTCSCPSAGHPALAAPAGRTPAAAFNVAFEAVGRPGLVRAVAVGCSNAGGVCIPGAATPADASARAQALFALLPALRTVPAAALTARGAIDADTAAFGVHNSDAASGGLAIDAGGAVRIAAAHVGTVPGASTADAIAANDPQLAALTPVQLFAGYFGLDKGAWSRRPIVKHMACAGDCTAALAALVANDPDPSLVQIDGDLRIGGPVTLGSLERPVVIVASGAVQFTGDVALTGVLYGSALTWTGTSPHARVRGAFIVEGDYQGDATPEIVYDAAVLARLRGNAGSFTRVNGSWRDF